VSIGITSGGRFFRRAQAPRDEVKYPYRAVVCGEEHIIKGWNGDHLQTDRGEYAFQQLQGCDVESEWPGEIGRPPVHYRLSATTILEVGIFQLDDNGDFLLNGYKLKNLMNLESGSRLNDIMRSEILRVHKQEIHAIAWFQAISFGDKTLQLDSVLADWKTVKREQNVAATIPHKLPDKFSLSIFAGWSKPVWLKRFHQADDKNSQFGDPNEKLHVSDQIPKPAPHSVAVLVNEGIGSRPARSSDAAPKAVKATEDMAAKMRRTPPVARFENDFTIAVIPQKGGTESRVTVEEELRKLVSEIIHAGGNKPRTQLRKGKSSSWQPEKLLESKTAKRLIKAKLLGKNERSGRTVVYWARETAAEVLQ
jgi:hypothetical protein